MINYSIASIHGYKVDGYKIKADDSIYKISSYLTAPDSGIKLLLGTYAFAQAGAYGIKPTEIQQGHPFAYAV